MKRAEALQVMEQDLKEVVSSLRTEEYNRALEKARDYIDLRAIELHVKKDSRLSAIHRDQLLRGIEDAIDEFPPSTQLEHSRLQAKTRQRSRWRSFP